MWEIPNFRFPNSYNDTVYSVEDAAQNRRYGIADWAAERFLSLWPLRDIIMGNAGLLSASVKADQDAHMLAVKAEEDAFLAAVQAAVDSTDTDENKIAAIGLIVVSV